MSRLTVVAKVVAHSDVVETVKSELLKLIVPTRQESGCIEYTLHQDTQDPAIFLFYETWESAAALQQHIQTDHYTSYIKAVDGKIKEKIVHKMSRIA